MEQHQQQDGNDYLNEHTTAAAEQILDIIFNNPRTTKLDSDFDDSYFQNMPDENWEQIGSAIANNTHLTKVDASKGGFLFRGLTNSETLEQAIERKRISEDIESFHQQVQAFINGELVYASQAKDHRLMTTPETMDSSHCTEHFTMKSGLDQSNCWWKAIRRRCELSTTALRSRCTLHVSITIL